MHDCTSINNISISEVRIEGGCGPRHAGLPKRGKVATNDSAKCKPDYRWDTKELPDILIDASTIEAAAADKLYAAQIEINQEQADQAAAELAIAENNLVKFKARMAEELAKHEQKVAEAQSRYGTFQNRVDSYWTRRQTVSEGYRRALANVTGVAA
jgi:hypothetical protein